MGRIQNLSGCQVKKLPFKYLGAPIYKGRCRSQFFVDLVETFAAKIEGWHSRFLSFGGKVNLLKTMSLQSASLFFLLHGHSGESSKTYCKPNELFSVEPEGPTRIHWVSWSKVCRSESKGGLGVRSMADTIFELHRKLA